MQKNIRASGISFFLSLAGGTTPLSFCRNDFLVGSADEDASPIWTCVKEIFFPPGVIPIKLPGKDIEIDVGIRWSVANVRVRKLGVKAKVESTISIMIMDAFATRRFIFEAFRLNQLERKFLGFQNCPG